MLNRHAAFFFVYLKEEINEKTSRKTYVRFLLVKRWVK